MAKADKASPSGKQPSGGARAAGSEPAAADDSPEVRGGTRARERKLRAAGKRSVRELMEAGMEVFGEKGYHSTRVEDIAAKAGLSHAAFYLYFTDKEDFLKALIEDCVEEMHVLANRLGPVDGSPEGWEALRTWIAEFIDLYLRYDPVTRAWTEAAHDQGTDLARLGESALGEFSGALIGVMEAHRPTGVDPVIAATALSAMLDRFTFILASSRVRFDREAVLDTLTTLMHFGLTGDGPPPVVGASPPSRKARTGH